MGFFTLWLALWGREVDFYTEVRGGVKRKREGKALKGGRLTIQYHTLFTSSNSILRNTEKRPKILLNQTSDVQLQSVRVAVHMCTLQRVSIALNDVTSVLDPHETTQWVASCYAINDSILAT